MIDHLRRSHVFLFVIFLQQWLVAELQKQYDLMKNDREYLETVARDRLDLMRDGETIIRLDRSGDAAPAALKQ